MSGQYLGRKRLGRTYTETERMLGRRRRGQGYQQDTEEPAATQTVWRNEVTSHLTKRRLKEIG